MRVREAEPKVAGGIGPRGLTHPPLLRTSHAGGSWLHADATSGCMKNISRLINVQAQEVSVSESLLVPVNGESKKKKSDEELQAMWDERHEWGAERIKAMILDLSGFYLKVGQVFATKSDLLPPQYVAALRCVFDDCPPTSLAKVAATIERELGAPVSELFDEFEGTPVGTATIAQVHRARLKAGAGALAGTTVAVKVQNPGSENLMRCDMGNMLRVAEAMDRWGMHMPFDHTSILREYQRQVPLEFDFHRERQMLEEIGGGTAGTIAGMTAPVPIPALCSKKVLTMTFVKGEPLGDIIARGVEGIGTAPGAAEEAARGRMTLKATGEVVDGAAVVSKLIESFGHQIFAIGKFHSDPHPGNILLCPPAAAAATSELSTRAAEEEEEGDGGSAAPSLALIDFGQSKVLDRDTRLGLARLTLALAHDERSATLEALDALGMELANAPPELAMTVAYVLFDTRMDIEEAHASPLDADLPEEMRLVRIATIPEDVFMLIRVVALIRGMLSAFDADVHARHIWRPFAVAALEAAGEELPPFALVANDDNGNDDREKDASADAALAGAGVPLPQQGGASAATGVYAKMRALALWMKSQGLPHDRKALMPIAGASLYSTADIAAVAREEGAESERLIKALRKFTDSQRAKCVEAALEQDAEDRTAAAAAAAEEELARNRTAAAGKEGANNNINGGGTAGGLSEVTVNAAGGSAGAQAKPKRSLWRRAKRWTYKRYAEAFARPS